MSYIPFTRPTLDEDTIASVADTLRSGWLASGPRVVEFETALSAYLGGRPVRTLTSATAALEVALQVCGIGPGDEVVTPAMSFAATPNMIAKVGAKPVFVDVDARTRNIDLDKMESAIGPRTRAIMPVHFAGLSVDLDRLYDVAGRRGLRVIEDASHAIGTEWNGTRVGARGDLVVFSFHPNKNMTSIEGGAISFASDADAKRADPLRFHGIVKDADGAMDVVTAGGKFNLPDVNARLGIAQLRRLPEFNARRRELAQRYLRTLRADPQPELPADGEGHCWHMFAPLIPFGRIGMTRREFVAAMHARGFGIGVHYQALHTFSFYRAQGYAEEDFPNAARIGRETVTLPLFPTMRDEDVDRVCDAVAQVLARR